MLILGRVKVVGRGAAKYNLKANTNARTEGRMRTARGDRSAVRGRKYRRDASAKPRDRAPVSPDPWLCRLSAGQRGRVQNFDVVCETGVGQRRKAGRNGK
jgi:hypothetical protein